ncbi:uncharacterized protein LOC127860408 isoform X2 [Dreissena polymorpha]|uniref:Uncharacterized protein n=1 Tax=Dreissena polymorpha TaxID=45954 RepID=A0A9D3YW31_DREPO|nr:uncharacterized protein LOC127860408 isoform X2 [Dreissena polymorpha]KAH3705223.1 hypothetical protein DPMN_080290 [Dreissena polymorpha]
MRRKNINLTSIVCRTLLFLQALPLVLSCIYLLNGWTPMPIFNRTARADVVIHGHVLKTYKEIEHRTDAMTYTSTVKMLDVYKGKKLLRNILTPSVSQNIYNISNFGDRKMCYADVTEGKDYILFLTTYKQRLSAKYDDIFGASAKYSDSNAQEVMQQVGQGVADWAEWTSCSKSCDGGQQNRKRNCSEITVDCDTSLMDRRSCNVFSCEGLHDVMSYLGVYKLPVGVYHVTQRPGAFDVTSAARLYTPFYDMFAYGLPRSFSIVASVKCPNDSNGYLFTICDSNGDLQLGLEVGQNNTAFSVTFHLKSGLSDEASLLTFSYNASVSAWKQFGVSVHDDVLELHYNCDKIYSIKHRGLLGKQGKTNLMMSIGKYKSSDDILFEGALEQLVISENVLAAEEQCTAELRDSDRAVKDESDNFIEDISNALSSPGADVITDDKPASGISPSPPALTSAGFPEGEWTEWSECSRSCGRGVQVRTLYCGNNVISACSRAGRDTEQARWCYLGPCQVGCQPPCANGGRCLQTGECFCPQGFTGRSCETVPCDPACMNGGRCFAPGLCQCPHGYTGQACQSAICDPPCNNGGQCIQPGFCSCPYGYMPPTCEPICMQSCRNGGRCVSHNQCHCKGGYVGSDCSIAVCRRGCYNGGRCTSPGQCACVHGFVGSRCHKPVCSPACQNNGRCLYPGICQCKRGYSGPLCETAICRKPCKNGGVCSGNNRCACADGYRGRWCHRKILSNKCRLACMNGGRCRNNKCLCTEGFKGERCEKQKCRFDSYLVPHVETYRKLERFEVVAPCETWPWTSCVETRVQYVLASRTVYRTEYRCL